MKTRSGTVIESVEDYFAHRVAHLERVLMSGGEEWFGILGRCEFF